MRRVIRPLSVLTMLLVASQVATVPLAPSASAAPAPTAYVDLGSAASYSVLAGAGVSNPATAADTVLALDLGLSPAGVIAGFPPGKVTGTKHDKDDAAATAQEARQSAYDEIVARPGGTPFGGDQAGAVFTPGLWTSAAAVTNTGTITLDAGGDPGAVFVFQVGAAFSSAAASKIVLTGGALADNVFWQVLGAVSIGAGAKLVGTFLSAAAVALGAGASLKGRILTASTVALDNNPVTQPIDDLTAPLVSIDGGVTRSTSDATPMVSGTTDEPTGRPVVVTVAGQTLTTTIGAGGAWAVSATTLAAGTHHVTATVTDPSHNTGSADQDLTVDVTLPALTITGGAAAATQDTTPTIAGTTDAAEGTGVQVEVAGQTLSGDVDALGTWSVEAAPLTEAAHGVVATVADAAGNTATAYQVLDVDLTVPVVTIDGGATRSTDDTSPWTYGTTAERAGTTVHLAVGGQDLTATVAAGGTWGVSAQSLTAGAHHVVATVTDAAGNTGTATQTLTIGTPPPVTPPAPRFRPDAAVRVAGGSWVGVGTYAAASQRVTRVLKPRTRTATYTVRVTNRGDATDALRLHGTSGSKAFKVVYLVAGRDVTKAVLAGTYRTTGLRPGASLSLTVRVTRTAKARPGAERVLSLRAVSAHRSSLTDTVAAVVRARG